MSADDFTVHDDECERRESDWMPISDLPDEVESLADLDCECWECSDSLGEVE